MSKKTFNINQSHFQKYPMRVFHLNTLQQLLLIATAAVVSFAAWGQSPRPENQTPVPETMETKVLVSQTSKELTFAEKQFLNKTNPGDYRDKYSITCLIYSYRRNFLEIEIIVLSTYKINRCNPITFLTTNASSVKAQLLSQVKSDYVVLSGPHIQMMDFNNTPVENPYIPIGSLNYTAIATASFGIKEIVFDFQNWDKWIRKLQSYSPIKTHQDMDYAWFPGATIYKLITDDGKVFILTNFMANDTIKNPEDVEREARYIGSKLNLPSGWKFEEEKITKVIQIKQSQHAQKGSNGHAHIQDEFGNIYLQLEIK